MYQSICTQNPIPAPALYKNATGKLPYTLTNDYLFRATLQESPITLREIVRSVLGLPPEETLSVEILNPITLGKHYTAKDFIMDTRVCINNHTYINLEMQVVNYDNWPERSLQYLCRSFNQLNKGEDYDQVKPVVQVCFLNFTLFKDIKEFFSTYMFTNIKNHRIYSDKLKLLVIDLTCIDLATQEDKSQHTDYWASLFKATTWEDIHMLATKNTFIEDTAETMYRLSADDTIREQCEAREDYYRLQRTMQNQMKRQLAQIAERDTQIAEKNNQIAEKDNQIAEKDNQIAEKDTQIAEKDNQIAEKDNQIAEKDNQIAEKDNQIAEKDNQIAEKDNQLQHMKRSQLLFQLLSNDNRYADLQRAYTDEAFFQSLLDEYQL